jgi:outer membrane protein assembly factor BamA
MRGWYSVRRVVLPLAIAMLAALSLHPRALAQTPASPISDKLASIKITGSARFRSEQIASAIGLAAGATIGKDDLQDAANRLALLGPFLKVDYRYGSSDAGVRAEFTVADAPPVRILFDNFPWFTDDELAAALKTSVPLFDGASPQHGTMLDDMSHELQRVLATRGIVATVSHSLISAPAGEGQVQQFRVDDQTLNVASVEFGDSLAQSDRGLQTRVADLIGTNYSRTAVELFEAEQVRPMYVSHAFLRVRFGTPTARLIAGDKSSHVAVVAPIEPGPAYSWNGVTWNGYSAIGVLELETLIPLHRGDRADGMKIESGWEAVRDDYARHGYLSASIATAVEFDDKANTVTYTAAITEGPQYRMGKLVLTGLSIEGERRIRAAWRISPGEVLDKDVFDEFIRTGIKQAFTGLPFNYEKVGSFLQENTATGVVDVLIDFQ